MMPIILYAGEFNPEVRYVKIRVKDAAYVLKARFNYKLSPTANNAIQKGVPLSWIMRVKMQQNGRLWNKTLFDLEIPYVIQYHALLNQYSVTNRNNDQSEMFVTLSSAMRFMTTVRKLKLVDISVIEPDEGYFVSVKMQFDREFLPIPLRPESYFDSQWSLSSDWTIWPIQK